MSLTKYEIKARMDEGKVTQEAIAVQTGFSQACVSLVVAKKLCNPKIEQAIADALSLSYEDICGDPPQRKAA